MATRPDLVIELNSVIVVWSYTPEGNHHLSRYWGAGELDALGRCRWELSPSVLDPLVHAAAMAGLLIVVRKAVDS